MILSKEEYQKAAELLKNNKIGVLPTDTIYGISCLAFSADAVERIYEVKKRQENKPFIILVDDIDKLSGLGIEIDRKQIRKAEDLWRECPTSIIFPCLSDSFQYLHRGTRSLAIRIPFSKSELLELLKATCPIVSTSANPEGKSFAVTIEEAEDYFGDRIDFYLDGGQCSGKPSRVVDFVRSSNILRN